MRVSIARRLLLAASTSPWLRERATKMAFVRRSVSMFMPGERLDEALEAAAAEQARGHGTLLTTLGENLTRAADAEAVMEHYVEAIDCIASRDLNTQISVKLTQLGLDFDVQLCLRSLERLVEQAHHRQTFVWVDMES